MGRQGALGDSARRMDGRLGTKPVPELSPSTLPTPSAGGLRAEAHSAIGSRQSVRPMLPQRCTCPFTTRHGHFEVVRFSNECPEHGEVAEWMGDERMARLLNQPEAYFGRCSVCQADHLVLEGNCGKG